LRAEELVRRGRIAAEGTQVAPGGEHLLVRGREDDDPDFVVALRLAERREQLGQQLVGERVARLRVVEGDRRDVVGNLVTDLFELGHRREKCEVQLATLYTGSGHSALVFEIRTPQLNLRGPGGTFSPRIRKTTT